MSNKRQDLHDSKEATQRRRALTKTSVGLDPLLRGGATLLLAELAPVVDLDEVAALHDVGDVPLGVDLLAVLQDLDLVLLAGGLHVSI